MLYNEVGSEVFLYGEEYVVPPEIREAAARRYNEFCSSGSWRAKCLNSYWGYYQPIRTASSSKQAERLDNVINEAIDESIRSTFYSFSADVINHNVVGNSGYDSNEPFGWVNVYSISGDLNAQYYRDVTVPFQDQNMSNSDQARLYFAVLSPNQQMVYCGGKLCNLSYAVLP
jgi:hypothetical protein